MLASKYADASPTSPLESPRRSSSLKDPKPLPPLPTTPNGVAPEQHTLPDADSSKPSPALAHSRNASRDQDTQNGSPLSPRLRRNTQRNSTSDARVDDALPPKETAPAKSIPPGMGAAVVPTTETGAPDVVKPEQIVAGSQSRESAPTPEPPRAQLAAPPTKIPAKKMTSKKGRPCIIRIPKEFVGASTKKQPMSLAEFSARLKQFESEGYSVRGYDHDESTGKHPDDGLDTRNRFLFEPGKVPNKAAGGLTAEKPVVVIPDKKKWDQYRNDLVEAKLKALGVIPADPEPDPEAEQDPDQMDMSMQDHSMFPGMATSPPPMSSSVNSQHQWQGPAPFSAPFSPAGFTNNTSIAGVASPVSSLGGQHQMQRPGHLSRQSTFNFNFPAAFNPALQQQFSPQPGANGPFGFHRGGSPSLAGSAIPRIPSALSRNSPDPYSEQRQQTPRMQNLNFGGPPGPQPPPKNPRRTTLISSAHNSMPGSAQMTPQGSSQGFNNGLVSTPPNNQSTSYADLAYPTPRGHQSNISQNLEREAEKPQYYPGEYVDNELEEEASEKKEKPEVAKVSIDSGKPDFGRSKHTSTGSTSKFNVEAKEFKFDPKAAHQRQASLNKNPFMPDQSSGLGSKPTVSFVTAHANGETTGDGNFDARASAFKPPTQTDFSFGSAPFDFSKQAAPKPEPEEDKTEKKEAGEPKSKIFSGISFADFVKPAKKSKAIPIVNPNALPKKQPTPQPSQEETVEDESGRITQDISRHKRGRTAAPGGDDIPRFATPSSPGLTPQPESLKARSQEPESEDKKPESPKQHKPEAIKEQAKEDEDARWSDFGIDAPKTPPRRTLPKVEPLIDVKRNNESADTTGPRSVVSDATQAAPRSTWQSLLDSSPPRIPSPDRLPKFPDGDLDPTFQEIDEIMEQLNGQPHHGAEEEQGDGAGEQPRRVPSPEKRSVVDERLGGPSPELRESRLSAFGQGNEGAKDVSAPADWVRDQRSLRASASPVRKLNSAKEPEVSDWDEMISDKEAAKFLPQAHFFDTRIKSLIEGIMQQHLSPLQKALKDVDSTVKTLPGRELREAWPLVDRADKTESDADDEDNADETDVQRSRTVRPDKKLDRIRAIVQEAVASQQTSDSSTKRELDSLRSTLLEAISSSRPTAPAPAPQLDASEIRHLIQEVVNAKSATPATQAPHLDTKEIRDIVQEVVGAKQDSTLRLEDEMRLRNDTERKANDLQRLLDLSEKELSLYRESSDNTERQMQGLRDDKDMAQQRIDALEKVERELRARTSGLSVEVSGLQGTLEEYRTSSTRWRNEIDGVKKARETLQHHLDELRQELHHTKQSRDNVGAKLEKLQEALATATSNLQKERADFRTRDEELSKEGAVLGARLEEEFRTRQRLERELDRQGVHERNAVKATVSLEEVRNSNQRLLAEAAKLRDEIANERNAAQLHEREAIEAKDIARAEIQRTKTLLEAEIEVANMRTESTRTDLETRLDHVRGELSAARHENARIRQEHKQRTDEVNTQRTQAVREASESANSARQEDRNHFERLTAELSKQHDEAMKRVLDERQRAEVHFNETLKLSQEKNSLLDDRVKHLEDKVSVAQSAAKAAAEAAQQQSASKAKEAAAQREHLRPSERVSPQALRESIVVLQEQLQQRESRIESLESELDEVDKDLPDKYKERETEISWLRELLNVRLDDISELVNLLSLENYDRIAARDAAIRIRANLQMEQQEKERLIGRLSSSSSSAPSVRQMNNNPLPSLNDIQNFATPRAAQIAAAWGNWRKTGQSPSLASLRGVVSGQGATDNGSPSKPQSLADVGQATVANNASAAQTFLSGLMTPPASNLRRTPTPQRQESREREREDEEMSNMSDAQPLSLAAELGEDGESISGGSPTKMMTGGRNGRPRTPQAAGGRGERGPVTPPLARKGSYDLGAEMSRADADDDEGEIEEADVGAEVAADSHLAPLEA